jgi:deoxyribodipyrimidine photo-lyase
VTVPTTIVWFLQDLRLRDHAALCHAAARGRVLPVYVHDPAAEGHWAAGGARRWWLHHSLESLQAALAAHGLPLVLAEGPSGPTLQRLAREARADLIVWNRRRHPALAPRDAALLAAWKDAAADGHQVRGQCLDTTPPLLHDPDEVRTGSGGPYMVFTPFWKKLRPLVDPPRPLEVPAFTAAHAPAAVPASVPLATLGLRPTIPWDAGFPAVWTPGEEGARQRMLRFVEGPIDHYHDQRDLPAVEGTTGLSPHLVHGEFSIRQAWHGAVWAQERARRRGDAAAVDHAEHFLRELAWRDFAWHVMEARPETPDAPLKPGWDQFPWSREQGDLWKAWTRGRTGYPLVDAGMRQLWATGWMHNRVRMVVASFLTKHLLLHWHLGARWFWDTLVDADLANNTSGWQWAAGCGADAQPFFRIFNPTSQGQKFDAQGAYIRRWVPELRGIEGSGIHDPAPIQRRSAGYPDPIVDHRQARDRALQALHAMSPRG